MSGSIWTEDEYEETSTQEDTYASRAEAEAAVRRALEAEKLKDSPRKRVERPIPPARPDFRREAERLRQLLMLLLEEAYSTEMDEAGEGWERIPDVCAALERVDALSASIRNESERDLYAVCDLLAISLAATCSPFVARGGDARELARRCAYLGAALRAQEG